MKKRDSSNYEGEIVDLSIPDEDVKGWKAEFKLARTEPAKTKHEVSKEVAKDLANLNDAEADKLYDKTQRDNGMLIAMFEDSLRRNILFMSGSITGRARWKMFEQFRKELKNRWKKMETEEN